MNIKNVLPQLSTGNWIFCSWKYYFKEHRPPLTPNTNANSNNVLNRCIFTEYCKLNSNFEGCKTIFIWTRCHQILWFVYVKSYFRRSSSLNILYLPIWASIVIAWNFSSWFNWILNGLCNRISCFMVATQYKYFDIKAFIDDTVLCTYII